MIYLGEFILQARITEQQDVVNLKYLRISFYDWEGIVIYDKEPEDTPMLQRPGNNFNKLAPSPLCQQPVSTSSLLQNFNERE